MEQANWFIIPVAAILPLILGYLWYHPKVMGKQLAKLHEDPPVANRSIGKMFMIYVLGILLAYILTLMSVHQSAIFQLFFMDPALGNADSEYNVFINNFMETHGQRHRSFGHGMIHGAEAGLMFGLAFFGITALLQNKPFKTVWVHLGFWIMCCSLMAGIVCAFF